MLPAWLDVDQMLYPDCHCVHYVLYPACLCINSILFIALSIVDCFHLVAMSMMYRNCICVNDAWYLDWCQWCMVSRLSLCPWCIVSSLLQCWFCIQLVPFVNDLLYLNFCSTINTDIHSYGMFVCFLIFNDLFLSGCFKHGCTLDRQIT